MSTGTITLGAWHHIVGIIRGPQDMDIFIDCVNAGGTYNGTGSNQVSHTESNGRIGTGPQNPITATQFNHGAIDLVSTSHIRPME